MKRTQLKRTGGLRRVGRLIRRTALRKVGSRKQRRLAQLEIFREETFKRAGGVCEWCQRRYADDPHHLFPVGRGGPDEAWNGMAVCRRDHNQIHLTPGSRFIVSSEEAARTLRAELDEKLGP